MAAGQDQGSRPPCIRKTHTREAYAQRRPRGAAVRLDAARPMRIARTRGAPTTLFEGRSSCHATCVRDKEWTVVQIEFLRPDPHALSLDVTDLGSNPGR